MVRVALSDRSMCTCSPSLISNETSLCIVAMTCTSNKCTVPVLIHATFRIFFIYCSAMFMHVCEHKHCRTEHSQTNEYELTWVRVVPEAGQLVRMPTNSYAVWSSRTSTNSYADQLVRRPTRTPGISRVQKTRGRRLFPHEEIESCPNHLATASNYRRVP